MELELRRAVATSERYKDLARCRRHGNWNVACFNTIEMSSTTGNNLIETT
jgi:hypothetical protein